MEEFGMRTLILRGTLITPREILSDHALVIEGPKIASIEARRRAAGPAERLIDARGLWVAPGLIDVHVHGSAGHDTMDATPEALHGMARFFARHGVTCYLPTTIAASPQAILPAIENVAHCPQPQDGAHHLGVHLEGPYLNPDHRGAQPLEHLRDPDPREYGTWLATGCVRLITVAPELDGALALVEQGISEGVEFAVGHSGASYEQVLEAADCGLRQATHTFNGMLGLHHRIPGTLGAVLADDRIYAQVIVDGAHVHPAVVKLLVRAKGVSRTILITDAIRAAGLRDGEYDLGGQTITVREGIPRTAAGGLAGSSLTLDAGLRNAINCTGLSLEEALPMATSVPAEVMGLAGRKGVLAPGADADVILLDADLNVRLTMVAGQVVYQDI
jgi:N-acetylglucosamine-6-phosphate deacetylase